VFFSAILSGGTHSHFILLAMAFVYVCVCVCVCVCVLWDLNSGPQEMLYHLSHAPVLLLFIFSDSGSS
jgi:hypothetical protein